MVSSVRFLVTQKDLDESQVVSNEQEYLFTQTFEEKITGTFLCPNTNSFFALPYGAINQSSMVRLNCSESITLRVNGNSMIDNVENLILMGATSELEVMNQSGNQATITYEIYGD